MGNPRIITVPVVTDSGGAATVYTDVVKGEIVNVIYTKNDFANGVDFVITTEDSGIDIWRENDVNASDIVAPVQKGSLNTSGADSVLVQRPVYAANERIKIVIAQGGSVKNGAFKFVIN